MDKIDEINKSFEFLISQYGFEYLGIDNVWHVHILHYRKGSFGIGIEY